MCLCGDLLGALWDGPPPQDKGRDEHAGPVGTHPHAVIELGGAGPPGFWASGVLAGFLEEAMLELR